MALSEYDKLRKQRQAVADAKLHKRMVTKLREINPELFEHITAEVMADMSKPHTPHKKGDPAAPSLEHTMH